MKTTTVPLYLTFAAILLLAGGCGGEPAGPDTPPPDNQTGNEQTTSGPESSSTAQPDRAMDGGQNRDTAPEGKEAGQENEKTDENSPGVKRVGLKGVRRAVRRHRGSVVVLDFWATWCPPCIKAFPGMIELHRGFEDAVVISVSMDNPDKRMAEVKDFLQKHDPPFGTYILDVPEYSPFVREMGDEWDGGLPAVYIYDRAGKRRHELLGEHSMEEIRSRVQALLKEKPGKNAG